METHFIYSILMQYYGILILVKFITASFESSCICKICNYSIKLTLNAEALQGSITAQLLRKRVMTDSCFLPEKKNKKLIN